jgi:AcrR family transcriptional regulator
VSARRPYDSPVRRSRVAETRERIVAAGSQLVHGFEAWEWDQLTFRAVAEQAGVGERTVYRHFPTERLLHEAVMHRLHEEAGVDYATVTIDNLVEVTGRVLDSMGQYPTAPTGPQPADQVFAQVDVSRREALARVVAELDVPEASREEIAAVLDVLWNLPAFERLVVGWQLEPERASAALAWLVGLVLRAALAGETPPDR